MHGKIPAFSTMHVYAKHVSKHTFFAVPAPHSHAAFFRWPRETSSP